MAFRFFNRTAKLRTGEAVGAMHRVFAKAGMSFSNLHPAIYSALLKEAMIGGAEGAFAGFVENIRAVEKDPGNNHDKSLALRNLYIERGKRFAEAFAKRI
jgi:hypothetical protein